MSRPITLFSGYSQGENRTTNYCLLVLKLLYEENPKFLGHVLGTLVGENLAEQVGVQFRQQTRKAMSAPDGLVTQPAFTLYLETKNFDWFHDAQLENHLSALDGEAAGIKVLIALSNFEVPNDKRFSRIRELCESRYRSTIRFAQISFEDLVEALQIDSLPKNLMDLVSDFRAYLDEQNLLPSWKGWIDVVNCAGIPDDILTANAYLCPATGGPYNHSRCKYFGMYRNKRVEKVAMIEAVVDLRDTNDAVIRWKNTHGEDEGFIARAHERLAQRRPGQYPTRVFILGELFDTDFSKDTSGGMQSSKQYFDIEPLRAANAAELADALRGKTWSQLRGQVAG
jgi:hypothetical protein